MTRLVKLVVYLMASAPVASFGMAKTSSLVTPQSMRLSKSLDHISSLRSSEQWNNKPTTTKMSLGSVLNFSRGGSLMSAAKGWNSSPASLFNSSLGALAALTVAFKILQRASAGEKDESAPEKPQSVKDLQVKFLSVFWLLRCADWLQGPYFYEVYASKVFDGVPASLGLVSKLFLTGFASTALFGPLVGRTMDVSGRKKGTLAFTLIYALGAASTKSPVLQVLFLGRILSGIGTSLLFSAPESWLVGEAQKSGDDPDGSWLGETFGLVRCRLLFSSRIAGVSET
jgi:hypothetical protein